MPAVPSARRELSRRGAKSAWSLQRQECQERQDPHKSPLPPHQGSSEPRASEGPAKAQRLHRLWPAAPEEWTCLALPGLVPAGGPGSIGRSSWAGAAGGSVGLARSFSDRELLSAGRMGG